MWAHAYNGHTSPACHPAKYLTPFSVVWCLCTIAKGSKAFGIHGFVTNKRKPESEERSETQKMRAWEQSCIWAEVLDFWVKLLCMIIWKTFLDLNIFIIFGLIRSNQNYTRQSLDLKIPLHLFLLIKIIIFYLKNIHLNK